MHTIPPNLITGMVRNEAVELIGGKFENLEKLRKENWQMQEGAKAARLGRQWRAVGMANAAGKQRSQFRRPDYEPR